jgi:exodeoxyribonuclease V alpha subunit
MPTTERAVQKFLRSGIMMKMNAVTSAEIAKTFGADFFTIARDNPEALRVIAGVGPKKCRQIQQFWQAFQARHALRQFLFENELPLNWTEPLEVRYGGQALSHLQEKPYTTARETELAFDIIDAFVQRSALTINELERARAALMDALKSQLTQGHCAYPEAELKQDLQFKLGVPRTTIEEALEIEVLQETLVDDTIKGVPCLYLRDVWELERQVAENLLGFLDRSPPWGWFQPEKVLGWAQRLLQIQLAPLQKTAIDSVLSSALTVITGGPGTGKTTLIRALVTILQTQHCRIALCAPTGRAAQRLGEATATPAQTLHRLLKYHPESGEMTFDEKNPLDFDLVLVDEASMVDLKLMSQLLCALSPKTALVLVGDADQIPSVGAGSVLQSIIACGRFNTVRLTDSFRQTEFSLIKLNAQRINRGEMPCETPAHESNLDGESISDFHYIPVVGPQHTRQTIFELITNVIPQKYGVADPRHVQILTPVNKGPLGTQQLNIELQRCFVNSEVGVRLGPDGPTALMADENGTHGFCIGDKIMVTKNDYNKEVFNGDIGFISKIDPDEQLIYINFDERTVLYAFDEMDRLCLAYAISVHKSQGSEYDVVIVVVSQDHLPMVQKHLIYTAVTRGKKHVFLVAESHALATALKSDESLLRWQKLTELLTIARP